MRTVWKFVLGGDPGAPFVLDMPRGAIVRHVGLDPHGVACLWAEVDPDSEGEPRSWCLVGTGWPHEYERHVGSFVQGPFVWHLYELETP